MSAHACGPCSQPDYTVSIYEYEGVFVIGELSVADFREAIGLVRPQLEDHERITELVTSACRAVR